MGEACGSGDGVPSPRLLGEERLGLLRRMGAAVPVDDGEEARGGEVAEGALAEHAVLVRGGVRGEWGWREALQGMR